MAQSSILAQMGSMKPRLTASEYGAEIKVTDFYRYEKAEGIGQEEMRIGAKP